MKTIRTASVFVLALSLMVMARSDTTVPTQTVGSGQTLQITDPGPQPPPKMNSRKIILGLVLVGVLGLVLWQINRRQPPTITRAAPAPRSAEVVQPGVPTESGLPAKPAAPASVAAAPAATPVA